MAELVSCLCITTRSRRTWFANALLCFESQTYEPRELVIVVDDDTDAYILDFAMTHTNIRVLVDKTSSTVGEKRNIGCQFAKGDLIAVWDDDDWSATTRLSDQIERLKSSGKSVTAYHSMKFTDGKDWWLYEGIPSVGVGTSLLFRKDFWNVHRFPHQQVAEDNAFIYEARRCGQYVSAPANDFMYATVHPGNTSPRDLRTYTKL